MATRRVSSGRKRRTFEEVDLDDDEPIYHKDMYVNACLSLLAARGINEAGEEVRLIAKDLLPFVDPKSTAVDRLMFAHSLLGGLARDDDPMLRALNDDASRLQGTYATLQNAELFEVPVDSISAGLDDIFDGIGRYMFTTGAWQAMTETAQWTDHIFAIFAKAHEVLETDPGIPPLAAPGMFITTDKPLVFHLFNIGKETEEFQLMESVPSALLCGGLRRAVSQGKEEFTSALLVVIGFIVGESGIQALTILGERDALGQLSARVAYLHIDGHWTTKCPLLNLTVYALLHRIYSRIGEVGKVRPSLREKRAWKKSPRVPRAYPKPFYRVKMSTALSPLQGSVPAVDYGWADSEGSDSEVERGELIYQHSVSAHSRLFIRRGQLVNLDSKKRSRLEELEYTLITEGHLPEDIQDMLRTESRAKRGIGPRGHDEWIAFKTVDVKRHFRGPEDAPYIPSTRVLE